MGGDDSSQQRWILVERLQGKVQAKEQALSTYEDAIVEGRSSSFLLEKCPEGDKFAVIIMLRSSSSSSSSSAEQVRCKRLSVRISFATELTVTSFNPSVDSDAAPPNLNHVWTSYVLPMAFTPGEALPSTPHLSGTPHAMSITVKFSKSNKVLDVKCPSHHSAVRVSLPEVALKNADIPILDRDFRLLFRTGQISSSLRHSTAFISRGRQRGDKSFAAIVEERPQQPDAPDAKERFAIGFPVVAPIDDGDQRLNVDLIFVVDCSGSMCGSRITNASRCLKLFLRCLPLGRGIRINVVRFGSTYEVLFKDSLSVPLDEVSLNKAVQFAEGLRADLGGTNLLPPLHRLLTDRGEKGYVRQLFILTDGQIDQKR